MKIRERSDAAVNADKQKNKSRMQTEEEFLASYSIEEYDRPSVTTDVVALTARSENKTSSEHKLSLLMIKRGEHPFLGKWALPGGFLRANETLEECALREITEETGVTPTALLPVASFSKPDRDPRGRIISNAYVSVISEPETELAGGDDADEAEWFDVDFDLDESGVYRLTLTNGEIKLSAKLKRTEKRQGLTEFEICENDSIAFDHAKIIATAISMLRQESAKMEIVFSFLPEKFTLTQLQRVQETIADVSLLTANFRRKISACVEKTDEFIEGDCNRPARLYIRKK